MSPNADLAGIDTSSEDFCDIKSVLDSIGICTKRFNSDQIANNNGLKLIECCRTFGLRIVNGRFGDAKNIGKFTYYYNKNGSKSVVDYIIMSDALLPLISAFEVDLFDDCMSDVQLQLNYETVQKKYDADGRPRSYLDMVNVCLLSKRNVIIHDYFNYRINKGFTLISYKKTKVLWVI